MKHLGWVAAIVALVTAGTVGAHHSISMFDISTPIWVKGAVVSHDAINPHSILVLEETADDGNVRRWLVEGPSLRRLERMAIGPDFFQTGDVIEVCGFPPKPEFSGQRASLDTVGYPPQVVHGHVLVMTDGQMSMWGSYGKLENCIRPGDRTRTWLDFVDTDPAAQAAWCSGRGFAWATTLPPTEFVDEVSRRMTNPCE